MSTSKHSTILPASKVVLDKRKLIFCEQPETPVQVVLNRDGNSIRSIEIRCHCGEQIVLDCVYADEPASVVQ